MKQIVTLLLVLIFSTSCSKAEKKESLYPESAATEKQTPEQLGKQIFESIGNCFACHKSDQKIIGPSIQEIAKTYKEKGGDIMSFLKGNEEPIVDPSQFSVMKTNFAITKNMSDDELKALEAYIYSNLK